MERMDPLQHQQCRVCGEPAAGFHFGAFTCEGCKSFFGRTCNNQSVIQECKNNYRCVVDKKNRTACKACRLRKCLMVGMSKSGSRYGRRSNWFKIHCLMQNQKGAGTVAATPPPSSEPWPLKSETSDVRDSSFGTNSRSPSPSPPVNTSFDSIKRQPMSPPKIEPLQFPSSPQKSPLLSSPELDIPKVPAFPPPPFYGSLPLLGAFSPFYKLSPLLAHNPLLNHPLLLQLQGQRNHLDLLAEHRQLLAKFGVRQQMAENLSPPEEKDEEKPEDEKGGEERPVSPPQSTDIPIDLSVKISTSAFLLGQSTPSSHLSPPMSTASSNGDTENIDDDERGIVSANALDLTVAS